MATGIAGPYFCFDVHKTHSQLGVRIEKGQERGMKVQASLGGDTSAGAGLWQRPRYLDPRYLMPPSLTDEQIFSQWTLDAYGGMLSFNTQTSYIFYFKVLPPFHFPKPWF